MLEGIRGTLKSFLGFGKYTIRFIKNALNDEASHAQPSFRRGALDLRLLVLAEANGEPLVFSRSRPTRTIAARTSLLFFLGSDHDALLTMGEVEVECQAGSWRLPAGLFNQENGQATNRARSDVGH